MSAALKKSDSPASEDALAPVYALLAELLSREIDQQLLDLLRLDGVKDVLAGVAPKAAASLDSSWNKADFEKHAVEFCRLFIHPAECLPLAGKWTGKADDETFSVRRWFEDDLPDSEMPKHLAELSDTHVAKIFAIRAGMTEVATEVVSQYEEEMIHPWRNAFAKSLSDSAKLPIYRAVAEILRAMG